MIGVRIQKEIHQQKNLSAVTRAVCPAKKLICIFPNLHPIHAQINGIIGCIIFIKCADTVVRAPYDEETIKLSRYRFQAADSNSALTLFLEPKLSPADLFGNLGA